MKKSVYDKLEDIPQIDRDENNYQLCQEAGSPNFNKYVLILDGAHPVQAKNTQLLTEKATKDQQHQTVLAQKDTEIQRLTGEVAAAKQTSLPAGHVAVPLDKFQTLQQFETLGKFDEVKTKVEEFGTLKEKDEANTRKTLLSEAARAHSLDPDAFVALAEPKKLADALEMREIPDAKGNKEKHYFVKHKDAEGKDTMTVLSDYVKTSDDFKPFLASLTPSSDKKKIPIPPNKTGETPAAVSGAKAYINSAYKRPDKKE